MKYRFFLAFLVLIIFHNCKREKPTVINQCQNGIRDVNEKSVDCGGACPDCNYTPYNPPVYSCEDGIQNGSETGIDCGGGCPCCLREFLTFEFNDSLHYYENGCWGGATIISIGDDMMCNGKRTKAFSFWPEVKSKSYGTQTGFEIIISYDSSAIVNLTLNKNYLIKAGSLCPFSLNLRIKDEKGIFNNSINETNSTLFYNKVDSIVYNRHYNNSEAYFNIYGRFSCRTRNENDSSIIRSVSNGKYMFEVFTTSN